MLSGSIFPAQSLSSFYITVCDHNINTTMTSNISEQNGYLDSCSSSCCSCSSSIIIRSSNSSSSSSSSSMFTGNSSSSNSSDSESSSDSDSDSCSDNESVVKLSSDVLLMGTRSGEESTENVVSKYLAGRLTRKANVDPKLALGSASSSEISVAVSENVCHTFGPHFSVESDHSCDHQPRPSEESEHLQPLSLSITQSELNQREAEQVGSLNRSRRPSEVQSGGRSSEIQSDGGRVLSNGGTAARLNVETEKCNFEAATRIKAEMLRNKKGLQLVKPNPLELVSTEPYQVYQVSTQQMYAPSPCVRESVGRSGTTELPIADSDDNTRTQARRSTLSPSIPSPSGPSPSLACIPSSQANGLNIPSSEANDLNIPLSQANDLNITFLGTGCAAPSKVSKINCMADHNSNSNSDRPTD